ncbi:MAG: flagellar M-ring protein FliF [Chloroflexi bacterium]|nr:flagellar M-ring protein FliF [Chloroflexota bacterium]
MKERLDQVKEQLVDIWKRLSQGQKMAIAFLGVIAVAASIGLVIWAQMPDYATLFSGLSQDDASAITTKLNDSKIQYQLADGGTTIRVPSSQVDQTRLDLAGQGLPKGSGVGFEIFDQTNFGMTDFTQQINYQRALEGELSRTINQLSEVEQSRVHIVIPQPTIYTDNQTESTASVVLKLRPGAQLTPEQVKGVSHLVASAVEGLKPENLTILDTDGNLLSDASGAAGDATLGLTASQMDIQRQVEGTITQKAQGLLDKVLGPGKAAVRVSATLDWDTFQADKEIYSPNNAQAQVRSSHTVTETSTSQDPGGVGVPGVASNVPGYQATTTTGNGGYSTSDTTTNYELSKSTETTVKSPGSIKKLSVAVVVDSATPASQVTNLQSAISAAVGIDQARGDTLTMTSVPFDKSFVTEQEKAMSDAERMQMIYTAAKVLGLILVPVLLLVFLRFLFKPAKREKKPKGKKGQTAATPELAFAMGRSNSPNMEIATGLIPPEQLIAEGQRRRMVQQQVSTLARQQPDAIAQVVQTWLAEDEDKR